MILAAEFNTFTLSASRIAQASDVSSTWFRDLPVASKSNCNPSKHLKARQQHLID